MTAPTDRVTLRAAHHDDAEAIACLHTESWRRTYRGMMTDEFLDVGALENRRGVWHERLGTPGANQYTIVAQDRWAIVGFICAFADEDAIWGSYIDNLHVAPDMHRRGVGRALMRSVGEWLCQVQPERGVYLWVMEANASARRFYERLGATNADTVDKVDPGGGHAPNCRYVWSRPHLMIGV
jgi:ribosomal protein S18 acetylase RimI-like enzyme